MADARHFIGAVGMLNSLRLVGHDDEVLLVDAGLQEHQRRRLAEHATVRPIDTDTSTYLAKFAAAATPAADVRVAIDADILVLRPLRELIGLAESGKFVGFADPVAHRHFPEWGPLLGLRPPRRQPYVNTGLLVLPDRRGRELLRSVQELGSQVDIERSQHRGGSPSDPFYYYDQDVWNALLASVTNQREVEILEHRLAPHPPFAGLEVVDAAHLRCAYPDGVEPFVLHHVLAKPWLALTRANIYTLLLRRVLLGDDVALRLEPRDVPLRLRQGRLAGADRVRSNLVALGRAQRGRLGLRRRLHQLRGTRQQ